MIIFDTDMSLGTPRAEIDDGAALIMLLKLLGEEVAAITTVSGNAPIDDVMHNTRRLLHYLGREDIVVGRGAGCALVDDRVWFDEWQAGYGETPAFGDVEGENSAEIIINTIRANPNKVTLIAVGPLTNLALAARMAPDIIPLTKQIIMMGGQLIAEQPEFNTQCDPEAAHIVLEAAWPIRMIGLGITNQVILPREEFEQLPETNRALLLLKSQAGGWIDRVESMGWAEGGSALHDALAVLTAVDESLFEWQHQHVAVTLCGEYRGATSVDETRQGVPTTQIATGVDRERCLGLFRDNLC